MFTPKQIEEILEVIDKYTYTFAAHHIGTDIFNNAELSILKKYGIDISKITDVNNIVDQAFKFGILSSSLEDSIVKNMSYDQFKDYLAKGKFIKLTNIESNAVKSLKNQTFNDVKKLGNRIKQTTQDLFVVVDKKRNTVKHTKLVTDITKKAIEDRKSVNYIVSELGHKTGEWNRDLGRIADYVLHNAFDEGRAMDAVKSGGDDALIYKDVYPGACKHCDRLYLTSGIGSAPKIFKVEELRANGTNIGRKSDEWLPIIGATHPWCRCTINKLPFGFTLEDYMKGLWEWNGSEFIRAGKYERKVKRKSKVKVTINDKEYEV